VIALLLVVRLLFGGAEAMSHAPGTFDHSQAMIDVGSSQKSACPSHESGSQAGVPSSGTGESTPAHPEAATDDIGECCETGGCLCPCMHAAMQVAILPPIPESPQALLWPDFGVQSPRNHPNRLFRPPA
jgi:hypothetical protein